MSATMDVDHFSGYFNKAPVLYIEGRQFPVKVKLRDSSWLAYSKILVDCMFLIKIKHDW